MFRFKLEALLNHRRNQEEAAQKEFAQARRKLADEQSKLNQKKIERQECIQDLEIKKKKSASVSNIKLSLNYLQQLSIDIEDQGMCVHKASKVVDQKRNELVSCSQKHKTLKKLKSKDLRIYEQKLTQDERKLMDELASIRHARKI